MPAVGFLLRHPDRIEVEVYCTQPGMVVMHGAATEIGSP
jgi:hypothetical protein